MMISLWRHARSIFVAAIFFFGITLAHADEGDSKAYALAKQSACLGCHATNKKIVVPSFQSVAEKYKNQSDAQSFLKNKIARGGAGSWGVVPQCPQIAN